MLDMLQQLALTDVESLSRQAQYISTTILPTARLVSSFS
jgi:hypothetical protein